MPMSSFRKGKFGNHRLHGLAGAAFIFFIVYIDVRPATTPMGDVSAQNFTDLNCDMGCYAFGSYALRILIDGRGETRLVFFDSKALTALTAVPILLVLASVDFVSASMLASVYVVSVFQAKLSVPKLQFPIKDVPLNTKCLIIGVNDYVETYGMRWNHSCGYINYIHREGTGTAEKESINAKIFAHAVERYGDLYDLVFIDRGAGVDAGMMISSVPKWNMGMGKIFDTSETVRGTSGIDKNNVRRRVLVSRLRHVPEVYHEKIDGLKRWVAAQDSDDSSEEAILSKIFDASIPTAEGKLCSGKYLNVGDCMRNRTDSVLTIHWDEMLAFAIYVFGLYAIHTWMYFYKVNGPVGLCFQATVGVTCMFLGALMIGALGASPDDWEAWYSAGEGNLHVQNIILVALVSRSTWKASHTVFQEPTQKVVDEPDKLNMKLDTAI